MKYISEELNEMLWQYIDTEKQLQSFKDVFMSKDDSIGVDFLSSRDFTFSIFLL